MHDSFNFPIKCISVQNGYGDVQIKKMNDENYILVGNPNGVYDTFCETKIIPSIMTLVQKVKEGGNKEHYVKKWVFKWGLLKPEKDNPVRQSLESFWKEAEKFYDMWSLYRFTANRDLNFLKNVASVMEVDPEDQELEPFIEREGQTHLFRFFEGKEYGDIDILGFMRGNTLSDYQNAAMYYLDLVIQTYIKHGQLQSFGMNRSETTNEDIYKITPCMAFDDLLDAIYMQLYSLLTENNKKVCMVCNSPFLPGRQDAKYCSETCYNTAKSRSYRAKKNKNDKLKRII